ncbi:MAG: hemerythrin domain-containing protein [Gammaproteobacteria bacterium]|nr:MAG: hemerythrin domain-containing protein [Gammaproteobacteria bacterium]
MISVSEFFSAQHRACDGTFERMEEAVSSDDWLQAESLFDQLSRDTLQHFSNEEEGLFPLFEEKTGMQAGPTQVMRGEHVELRELLQRIGDAVRSKNQDEALGTAETFFLFLQQHNVKEEQVLYPMADQALQGSLQELAAKVPGFEASD